MPLTEAVSRKYSSTPIANFPVAAGASIYQGAAVGENASGYARPLTAGDPFLGFAVQDSDNVGGAAGDVEVQCYTEGNAELDVTGSSITSNDGAPVYASDDETFTTTAGGNSAIGNVQAHVEGTMCRVDFVRTRG